MEVGGGRGPLLLKGRGLPLKEVGLPLEGPLPLEGEGEGEGEEEELPLVGQFMKSAGLQRGVAPWAARLTAFCAVAAAYDPNPLTHS